MSGRLSADFATGLITGPDWRLRAQRVNRQGAGWRALVGVRRKLNLLVTADNPESGLWVEAWVGVPGDSDGVAVIGDDDADSVAAIPLCGCGERGCGNAGLQLAKEIEPGELAALVTLLRELPWRNAAPARSDVMRGNGLAALP